MVNPAQPGSSRSRAFFKALAQPLAALFGISLTWLYAPAISIGGKQPFQDPAARTQLIVALIALWLAWRGIKWLLRGMPRPRLTWTAPAGTPPPPAAPAPPAPPAPIAPPAPPAYPGLLASLAPLGAPAAGAVQPPAAAVSVYGAGQAPVPGAGGAAAASAMAAGATAPASAAAVSAAPIATAAPVAATAVPIAATAAPVAALAAPVAIPAPVAAISDGEALKRMNQGFDALLKSLGRGGPWWRLGRHSLYRRPWYVVLGEAGSGKSALARASGLEDARDLAEASWRAGDPCRWWVADEAVLFELAPPGSALHTGAANAAPAQTDAGVPGQAIWRAVLRRLRGARRRCPVNGVIVTLSAATLLADHDGAHTAAAAGLRARLKEMRATLGVHFPVYVVITQCDRLSGFRAYFDDLDAPRRAKVFGLTFPVADVRGRAVRKAPSPVHATAGTPTDLADAGATSAAVNASAAAEGGMDAFPAMRRNLVRRLHARMVRILGSRATLDRRAEVYGFPTQFDLLSQAAERLLGDVFAPSRQAPLPWIRGVYFTSAEPAGGRLCVQPASPLATELRARLPVAPTASPQPHGYFSARLLRDLIVPESGLAFRRPAMVAESRWMRYGAPAAIVSCTVAACVGVAVAARQDQRYMAELDDRLAVLSARARRGVALDQPASMLPLLDAARELAGMPPLPGPMSWLMPWRPAADVAAAGRDAYRAVLRQTVVPVIARRAMEVASDTALDAAQRYQALRVYLMLGTPRFYDAAVVLGWTQGQADSLLPARPQRQSFMAHVKALLGCGTYSPHIQLDPQRVARVRAQLMGYSTLDRVYADILRRLNKLAPGVLSVARMGGVNAPLALVRPSGRWLTEGVPGAYTLEGYRHYNVLRDAALADVEKDGWVLGADSGASVAARQAALRQHLDKLYFHHYIAAWDDLLNDLQLVPLSNSPGGIWLIKMLASADSPVRLVLKAAATQTTLRQGDAAAQPDATGAGAPAASADGAPTSAASAATVSSSLSTAVSPEPSADDGGPASVDRHFEALHQLFMPGPAGGPAPFDQAQAALQEAAVYLDAVQAARERGLPVPPGDALDKLRQIGELQPEPLRQMLQSLSTKGDTLALDSERKRLNDVWRSTAAFCHAALDRRYPLDPFATVDVTPDDFARVLGPGGSIDSFFQTNLLPYADTGALPWRWRPGGTAPKLSDAALAAFQRAATIRQAFFPDGGKTLAVRFQLQPLSLDASITRFSLTLSGQTLAYAHGPVRPVEFEWPHGAGPQSVRVAYETGESSTERAFTIDGPWALFRLLDRATIERERADRFKLTFNLGGRNVTLQLDASSVINPFALAPLRKFQCPGQL